MREGTAETKQLGSGWHEHLARLRADTRALIADGDKTSSALLEQLLGGEGYSTDTTSTLAEAERLIGSRSYDLLIVESNLTDGSGLDLVASVREKGLDVPVVLVTAFPTVASISKAIGAGAADYLTKPFPDLSRLTARLRSLLDLRIAEKLYTRISTDLAELVKSRGQDAAVAHIGQRLFGFKESLKGRPATILVEASAGMAELVQNALAVAGISSEAVTSLEIARERLADESGPLTAVVSLKLPGALEFIESTKENAPLVEIVATTTSPAVDTALAAVEAGAIDVFSRAHESLDALQARVQRAVTRSRRQRLHIHLVRTLSEQAEASGVSSEDAVGLVPPTFRHLLGKAAAPDPVLLETGEDPPHAPQQSPPADEAHQGRPLEDQAYADQAHADQAYADQAHADQAYADQAHADQAYADQAHADQAHADQAYADQAHADQAYADQAHADQAYADQAHADQAYADQAYADQAYADQAYADQAHADQAHADQAYADQAYADQAHADQAYADQAYADQAHADQPYPDATSTAYPKPAVEVAQGIVERRRAPRYPCALPVELRPWGTTTTLLPCRLRDISLGGMFIHLPAPPPIGTRFEIRIDSHALDLDREAIELVAEVVRSIRVEPDPTGQTGVGVRLLAPPPEMSLVTDRATVCFPEPDRQ